MSRFHFPSWWHILTLNWFPISIGRVFLSAAVCAPIDMDLARPIASASLSSSSRVSSVRAPDRVHAHENIQVQLQIKHVNAIKWHIVTKQRHAVVLSEQPKLGVYTTVCIRREFEFESATHTFAPPILFPDPLGVAARHQCDRGNRWAYVEFVKVQNRPMSRLGSVSIGGVGNFFCVCAASWCLSSSALMAHQRRGFAPNGRFQWVHTHVYVQILRFFVCAVACTWVVMNRCDAATQRNSFQPNCHLLIRNVPIASVVIRARCRIGAERRSDKVY